MHTIVKPTLILEGSNMKLHFEILEYKLPPKKFAMTLVFLVLRISHVLPDKHMTTTYLSSTTRNFCVCEMQEKSDKCLFPTFYWEWLISFHTEIMT